MGTENKKHEIDSALEQLSFRYERALQEYWSRIPLKKEFLFCGGDGTFSVISRGIWNHEQGPDFLSAKLRINDEIVCGDVEIHCRASDWIAHGHGFDPAYSNVILHAIEKNDVPESRRMYLPFVPHFDLKQLWTDDSIELEENPLRQGMCSEYFSKLSPEDILSFAEAAGRDRFIEKSNDLLKGMIQYGFSRPFYTRFLYLMGIPSNREAFRELSSRVFSYTEDVLCEHLPAILWGESDLLPDPSKITLSDDSKRLVHTLWNRWWDLRITARNRLEYKHGGRPLNSVERRLAVVEAFFSAFGYQPYSVLSELLDSVAGTPEKFTEVILERWNPPESYWKKHTSFTSVPLEHPAQIIGESRAVELLIDLIFPAMYASASLNRDEVRKDKILRYLPLLPADSGNRITRVMTDYCFRASGDVFHSSLSQQGLIHLYRNFCGKNSFDCNICAIYHSI